MSEAAASSGFGAAVGVTRLLSDDSLARRAVEGDERAFAAIFRRYHQNLYRYCLAIVGNAADAQDALQNTMVKVLRALPGEERRIDLEPWLYRIAHNESIEMIRRRRETGQLNTEQAAPGSGLAEEAASRERLRGLIADLGELPERQRGALVMRELAGLDFAEIGTALGTSAAVARQTLYEARLSLRQMDAGREMSCEKVSRALSDGDGRVTRRRDVRAHLRTCPSCRSFRDGIESRERDLAALSPLPAVAAAGLLKGLLGGGGAGGGGVAATLGSGAGSVGAAAALKGVAVVVLVGAVGVGVADRGGLIDVWQSGESGSATTQSLHVAGASLEGRPAEVAGSRGAVTPAGAATALSGGGRADAVAGADRDARTDASPTLEATAGEGAGPAQSKTNALAGEPKTDAAANGVDTNAEGGGSPPSQGSSGPGPPSEHPKSKGPEKEAKEQAKEEEKASKGQAKEEKQASKDQAKEEKTEAKDKAKEEKPPSGSPPGAAGREEHSQAPAPPPAPPAEEGPPGHGKGKKPQIP